MKSVISREQLEQLKLEYIENLKRIPTLNNDEEIKKIKSIKLDDNGLINFYESSELKLKYENGKPVFEGSSTSISHIFSRDAELHGNFDKVKKEVFEFFDGILNPERENDKKVQQKEKNNKKPSLFARLKQWISSAFNKGVSQVIADGEEQQQINEPIPQIEKISKEELSEYISEQNKQKIISSRVNDKINNKGNVIGLEEFEEENQKY